MPSAAHARARMSWLMLTGFETRPASVGVRSISCFRIYWKTGPTGGSGPFGSDGAKLASTPSRPRVGGSSTRAATRKRPVSPIGSCVPSRSESRRCDSGWKPTSIWVGPQRLRPRPPPTRRAWRRRCGPRLHRGWPKLREGWATDRPGKKHGRAARTVERSARPARWVIVPKADTCLTCMLDQVSRV